MMRLQDLDVISITTGLVAVMLVGIVGAIAIIGTPIPVELSIALSSVIAFLFGRGSSTPGTRDHTAALRENTTATQAVATTLEQAAPLAGLAATAALTEATDRNTATRFATTMRQISNTEANTQAIDHLTEATRGVSDTLENGPLTASLANTVALNRNTDIRVAESQQSIDTTTANTAQLSEATAATAENTSATMADTQVRLTALETAAAETPKEGT